MNCENCFCIYWKKGKCTLSKISLSISGACEDSVLVNINEEMLEKERKKILESYNNILQFEADEFNNSYK